MLIGASTDLALEASSTWGNEVDQVEQHQLGRSNPGGKLGLLAV